MEADCTLSLQMKRSVLKLKKTDVGKQKVQPEHGALPRTNTKNSTSDEERNVLLLLPQHI